jgi:hypothetical protein
MNITLDELLHQRVTRVATDTTGGLLHGSIRIECEEGAIVLDWKNGIIIRAAVWAEKR